MHPSDIAEHLPCFLKQMQEMAVQAKTENTGLNGLWEKIEGAWEEQFLYTIGACGISRWEKLLNIIPMPFEELKDRRLRIANKLHIMAGYTYPEVEEHLKEICGGKEIYIEYLAEVWVLKVRLSLRRMGQPDELMQWLLDIIPMNLILDMNLIHDTYRIFSHFTQRYFIGWLDKRSGVYGL